MQPLLDHTDPNAAAVAVTELSAGERRTLAKDHPEIARHAAAVVVAADDAELLSQAMTLVKSLQQRRQGMERTIEAMMPDTVPSKAAVLQARRNAAARAALLQEFGALTSTEIADLAGSKAGNRAALANRWRKEGRIFAMTHQGQTYFAAFQFDADGRPRPAIAEVLRVFGDDGGGWQTALWFTAANGWLDGARPIDLLDTDPQRVVDAARSEVEERVF